MAAGDPTFLCQGEIQPSQSLLEYEEATKAVLAGCVECNYEVLAGPQCYLHLTSHLRHNATSSIHNKYSLRQNVNFERGLCSFVNRPTLPSPPLTSHSLRETNCNTLTQIFIDFNSEETEIGVGSREWLLSKQYTVLVSHSASQSLNKRNSMSSL